MPRRGLLGRSQLLEASVVTAVLVLLVGGVVFAMFHSSGNDAVRAESSTPGGAPLQAGTGGPAGQAAATPNGQASQRSAAIEKERKRIRLRAQAIANRRATMPTSSAFRVASLNVLGSQHTRGRHSQYGLSRGGFGSGTTRVARSAALIQARGIDVIGMQEVQPDQLAVLRSALSSYSIWPQTATGRDGFRLQIAWRSDRFRMLRSGTVQYPFSHMTLPLPYVLLQDIHTRARFWVITTHNSAGGMEAERVQATAIEASLINTLRRSGLPVLITGDMNSHAEFFCRVAQATGFVAANGGSYSGGCYPPTGPLRVDWIMGDPQSVSFSGYVQDGTTRAQRDSDHYLVYADATVKSPPANIAPVAPSTGVQ